MTTDPNTLSDAERHDQAALRDVTYQEAFRKVANRWPSLVSDQAAAHQATLAQLMSEAHDEYDLRMWTAMPDCDARLCGRARPGVSGEPWDHSGQGHAPDCPRGIAIRAWSAQMARNRALTPTL